MSRRGRIWGFHGGFTKTDQGRQRESSTWPVPLGFHLAEVVTPWGGNGATQQGPTAFCNHLEAFRAKEGGGGYMLRFKRGFPQGGVPCFPWWFKAEGQQLSNVVCVVLVHVLFGLLHVDEAMAL